jgi:tight adherence protein C
MDSQLIFIACIFGAVTLIGYFVTRAFLNRSDDGKLRTRLSNRAASSVLDSRNNDAAKGNGASAAAKAVTPMLQKLGQIVAQPFMPKKRETQSALRRSLGQAGIYNPAAMKVMTGCKVLFLGLGLILGYVAGIYAFGNLLMGVSLGGLLGYIAPTVWLKLQVKHNQKELTYALSDALDLMVVCVEAGLTIDSAMQRVGQELAIAHPRLSRELAIAHMETRVGLSRAESLKNLGQRTGSVPLQSLASLLIQADRFGTSIGSALRIHSDSLRQARQHAAEEMAAKSAVKLSFPLVLFIFPATFIVLAGPTIIKLMESDFMK